MLIFKRTPNGRHRAAWFSDSEAVAAGKAAKSMGFRIKHLTDEGEQKEVMSQLPRGSLSNGGLTVPFVNRECLKQVLSTTVPKQTKATGVRSNPPAHGNPVRAQPKAGEPVLIDVSPNPTPTLPINWEEIQPGSEVLVRDQHDEAWYEAVVLSVAGDICQLRWRDYPGFPVLSRQRHHLALMHPAKKQGRVAE
ncbi:hypothetical protein AAII07_35715 [Microvirga sp. 0TCS3.31]